MCCGLFGMRGSFLGIIHWILCYCLARIQNHRWRLFYIVYRCFKVGFIVDHTTTIYGHNTQVFLLWEVKCRWACSGAGEFSFAGGAWWIIGSSCWIFRHMLACWFGTASEEWVEGWREWFKSDVFISNWFVKTLRDIKASEGEVWYIKCLAPTAQPLYVWAIICGAHFKTWPMVPYAAFITAHSFFIGWPRDSELAKATRLYRLMPWTGVGFVCLPRGKGQVWSLSYYVLD